MVYDWIAIEKERDRKREGAREKERYTEECSFQVYRKRVTHADRLLKVTNNFTLIYPPDQNDLLNIYLVHSLFYVAYLGDLLKINVLLKLFPN